MFRVVRPSSVVILISATVLGTASFIAVPLLAQNLLAQNGEPAKPAEAGKPEPAKEPAKPDPAKADPGKADPAKADPKGGEQAKGEPARGEPAKDGGRTGEMALADGARMLTGPAGRGECVWLGERAVGLLWKDDLDTAFRHLALYDRFGCPGEHIQVSFRCVVRQGNVQKDPKIAALFDDRVHACWLDPARPAEPASPPTASVEKPGNK